MSYVGDFTTGVTVRRLFTTRRFSTGVPYTLAGTPAISVYKDGGTTQSTTGVTLTADFDSVTGLNLVAIDTSADGTFYSAGSDFALVITTGTVDSVSVVGETVGSFSLLNRSALRPTTAGRTLDVSAGGEAGIDWANVGSPTTTVGLSGTTVKTATDVETDTADIQTRLPAALVSGRMDSSVGAMAANVLTATAINADAITAAKLAADVTTELQAGLATAASITALDGKIGTPAGASVSADIAALPTGTENADAFLDLSNGVETGLTPRGAFRLLAAALAGELSGAATTTIVIRNAVADSKDRITATVDADGNRSAITVDLT